MPCYIDVNKVQIENLPGDVCGINHWYGPGSGNLESVLCSHNGRRIVPGMADDPVGRRPLMKIVYYTPSILFAAFYGWLVIYIGFGSISPMAYVWLALLFSSAVLLSKDEKTKYSCSK